MLNNDEQIEEYEMSFYTLISEEEDNNKLKKNEVKGKNNLMFVIPFCRETISVFLLIIFIVRTPLLSLCIGREVVEIFEKS